MEKPRGTYDSGMRQKEIVSQLAPSVNTVTNGMPREIQRTDKAENYRNLLVKPADPILTLFPHDRFAELKIPLKRRIGSHLKLRPSVRPSERKWHKHASILTFTCRHIRL